MCWVELDITLEEARLIWLILITGGCCYTFPTFFGCFLTPTPEELISVKV